MDNQTRQFGGAGEEPRPRPKQYIPEPAPATNYAEPEYQEAYYQPAPQYAQQYTQPAPEKGDNVPAIVLGVLFAIATVAATVLFFLWRGAAAEADKPPVTVTQTHTVTTTETTTKRPSLFGRDGGSATSVTAPQEPAPQNPAAPGEPAAPGLPAIEVPPELRGIFDELREGAESAFQGQ